MGWSVLLSTTAWRLLEGMHPVMTALLMRRWSITTRRGSTSCSAGARLFLGTLTRRRRCNELAIRPGVEGPIRSRVQSAAPSPPLALLGRVAPRRWPLILPGLQSSGGPHSGAVRLLLADVTSGNA